MGQFAQDLGATVQAGMVVLGHRLGLYRAMAGAGPRIAEAFRTGAGVGWHEQDSEVFEGCELFFAPGYRANLVQSWIPALDGVEAKLRAGARVADVGCGHGASTIIMAKAYPNSTFTGFDYHQRSIDWARKAASEAGVSDRVRFEVAPADAFAGDGTWLLVEPAAGDRQEDNLNPVGRLYYGFSVLLCVPNALSQQPTAVLGNQAGEARTRELTAAGGFNRFRRAAETAFNLVYEVRP
jgi:SAM-dependent methyltransferase